MFLTETNVISVAKKQYFYKLKAYLSLLYKLAAIQLIILLLSSGRTGSMGSSNGAGITLAVNKFSNESIIIFTMAWAFIVSIIISSNAYRNIDFAFVSNRLSSNLLNIGFLLTAGMVGGITASLYSVLIRVILYFSKGGQNIISTNFLIAPQELLMGIISATLYMVIFSALGYLLGQINKIFLILLPAFLIGISLVQTKGELILPNIIEFFTHESSLALFTVKIIITASILFILGTLISNRREVRK